MGGPEIGGENLKSINYWDDFPDNPGFPIRYIIDNTNNMDNYPIWHFNPGGKEFCTEAPQPGQPEPPWE